MADGSATYSTRENRWVYAWLTSPVELTLSTATFTLTGPNGVIVSALDNVAATLVIKGPALMVCVGYKIDCTQLSAGAYAGLFQITDSTGSVWDVSLALNIVKAPAV